MKCLCRREQTGARKAYDSTTGANRGQCGTTIPQPPSTRFAGATLEGASGMRTYQCPRFTPSLRRFDLQTGVFITPSPVQGPWSFGFTLRSFPGTWEDESQSQARKYVPHHDRSRPEGGTGGGERGVSLRSGRHSLLPWHHLVRIREPTLSGRLDPSGPSRTIR